MAWCVKYKLNEPLWKSCRLTERKENMAEEPVVIEIEGQGLPGRLFVWGEDGEWLRAGGSVGRLVRVFTSTKEAMSFLESHDLFGGVVGMEGVIKPVTFGA